MAGTVVLPREQRANVSVGAPGVIEVWNVSDLKPNPLNPRSKLSADDPRVQSLAESIKAQGLIEPLVITKRGIVVAGHRRRLACLVAGVNRVRVIVRDLSEQEQLEMMVVENVQREDLNPLEEARSYSALMQQVGEVTVLARRVGIPVHRIRSHLSILRLAEGVQKMFEINMLPITASQPLGSITDLAEQLGLANLIAQRRLTVDGLREIVKQKEDGSASANPKTRNKTVRKKERNRNFTGVIEGPSRQEAREILLRQPGRVITFERILRELDDICCACGMTASQSALCRACPLPQLVAAVTGGDDAKM